MEVNQKIKEIISEQLSVDIKKVIPSAKLGDDLGADSLDLIELVMFFEESFDCEIIDEDADKLITVQCCYDYAKEHNLTE